MTLPSCFQRDFVDASKLPKPLPGSPTPVTKTYTDVVQLIKAKKIKEAKNLVRTQHWPIDDPNRGELWLKLCQERTKETVPGDFYRSTVRESLGGLWPVNVPAFVDPMFDEEYLLSAEGQRRAERVLFVMSVSHPFVTYCPVLHPVVSLLLHYLPEEQTYECVCALVDSTAVRHLSQTRLTHDISTHALMRLTKHLEKKTYSRLLRKVRREDEMENIFGTWQLWIFRGLPFYHLVRVMDCFLLEGARALYRIAMAILILYVKEHSKEHPSKSFISRIFKAKKTKSTGVSAGSFSREGAQDAEGFLDGVIAFCKDMPYNVDKFLKTAYNIQGISAKMLSQQLLKSEAYVRSRSSGRARPTSEIGGGGGGSHLQVASSRLSIKNGKYCASRAVSVGVIGLANFRSEVLTGEQMAVVWRWLPARITTLQPEVVYSTNVHGSSLTSLFAHADAREPTVLAVLTTRGERFGAYCSARWAERKRRAYFGTGETFLFTFAPEPRRFAWVGADSSQDVPHSSKLFLSANQHTIQIGGGNGVGLYIDGSLENGRTEHCDTFDNSPLAESNDFVVQIAEVVAFA
ncbi:GTPase-activating protein skywalker-like [Dermacentor variabilis]|uniref:GTPase-activating protein skywalker-like n=1 Tax=Dermacentor variabilis TaxID=34621 RepID=UPI003F5ADF7D